MDKLLCECDVCGDCMTATLTGAMDHHTARNVREKIDCTLTDCRIRHLTLDLHGIEFMDSAGLGLILGRYTRMCERGGTICLRNPSPEILRIIQLAGAEKYIPVEYVKNQKKESAVSGLDSGSGKEANYNGKPEIIHQQRHADL